MDKVIAKLMDEIKTKIAEKTLKDETVKKLSKLRDKLKKYMTNV